MERNLVYPVVVNFEIIAFRRVELYLASDKGTIGER